MQGEKQMTEKSLLLNDNVHQPAGSESSTIDCIPSRCRKYCGANNYAPFHKHKSGLCYAFLAVFFPLSVWIVKLMLDVKSEKLYTSDCRNGSGANDSTEVAETTPSTYDWIDFWFYIAMLILLVQTLWIYSTGCVVLLGSALLETCILNLYGGVVTFCESVLWPLIVTPVSCYTVLSLTVLVLSLLISCAFSFISVHFFFRACSAWADIRESGCLFRKSKSQDDRSNNYQSI